MSDCEEKDVKSVPKSLRNRYWTNNEELRLLELWGEYKEEVATTNHQQAFPVFRRISNKMKLSGFILNPQDVRRKLNGFKNQYIAEKKRLKNSVSYQTPKWRYYSLVSCILEHCNETSYNANHQKEVVDNLLNKINFAFKERKMSESKFYTTNFKTPINKKLHLKKVNKQNAPSNDATSSHYNDEHPAFEKGKGLTNIKPRLDLLKFENIKLIEECERDRKSLELEQKDFNNMKVLLTHWHYKCTDILEKIKNRQNRSQEI